MAAVTALGAGVRRALERVLAEPPDAWERHAATGRGRRFTPSSAAVLGRDGRR
ncbi:hypothetical protein [Kitasatospora phosalacinea]|uniref:hypothetical protein n=1 Tax=Kitasatospora phosalacinea TaxID=2065 RepID=UPI0025559440|nr:hypothetical protein [Kitasatospora phosalacinea]